MSEWAGLVPTGRKIAGGAADLVELDDGADGLKHTAIVFHERYRDHEALKTGIELSRGFMEFPMVSGLVEMSHWLPAQGAFIYPTGTSWTTTEVLRTLRDAGGVTVPSRAILEAAYLAGMILQEASETGPQQGVFAHGSMTPHRVLIKADGQVQIIGYGLPSVDLMMFREDETNIPNEDTFRYAPPERLAGLAEDGDSDVYCLCLILWELLSGEPVYDGSIDEVREMAKAGDADKRVTRSAPKQRKVPEGLVDLWVRSLNPDPDNRPSPLEFVQGVEKLLAENPDGVTLEQVMDKVRESSKRGRSLAAPAPGRDAVGGRGRPVGATQTAKGQLRAAGAGILTFSATAHVRPPPGSVAPPPAEPAAPEAGNRWGKPARARGAEGEGAGAEEKAATSEDARDKLRARLRGKEQGDKPAEAPTSSGSVEDARERLRARLKGKEDAEKAPEKPAEAEKPADSPVSAEDARERLRARMKQSSPDAKPEAAPESAPAEADDKPAEAPADAADKAVDPREALREKLRARSGGAPAAEPVAERAAEPKAEPSPEPAKPAAEPAPAADPRAALREKLRQRSAGAPAAEQPSNPPATPPAAPAEAAAPSAPATPPAAEDPREALRRKLRERSQGREG